LRLTEEGTRYFNNLVEKTEFFDQMKRELSESIPLNISQLTINNKIKHDKITKQILIVITINPPKFNKLRSTKQILNDLDMMIKIKEGTPLIINKMTTIYLDKEHGARKLCKQFSKFFKKKISIYYI